MHLMNLTKIPSNHIEFFVLGFLFAFRWPQNSNSSIFIGNIPFTLHPWIRLIDTKTNAKEQQICSSENIQKRAWKLLLCRPEWKKVVVYLFFPNDDYWQGWWYGKSDLQHLDFSHT